ncbi:MAG: putative transcriptional regulator [Firmicutes bacterium]|nr:putative transcriptional regulator [Bacillota bacterium]
MDTIGNMLYTERRKKGLEIVDAEQATGIRGVYLQALEQGKYEVLPGEVYVKGFIRNYGNYLELDGAHLVQLYSNSQATGAPAPAPVASPTPHNVKSDKSTQRFFSKKALSTVLVAVILILSAWSLYSWQQAQPQKNNTAQVNTATQAKPTPAASVPASNYAAGATATLPPGISRPVVLSARFSDRCWTSVIADGKTLYEGIPQNGETLTWEAERQIVVNFGNAGAVELTFNGQPVGKIGERGDVVVKTFTAKGLAATPAAPVVPASPAETAAPVLPAQPPVNSSIPATPAIPKTQPASPPVSGAPGGNR